MAYESSPYRHEETQTTTMPYQPASGYGGASYPEAEAGRNVAPAELADAFDDPAEGPPGRDRMAVHWLWELLLLGTVTGLVYLLWQAQPDALRGDNLATLLVQATGFLLLAVAAGLTLRAGAPNLAIGPMAAAAGAYFAERGGEGVLIPTVFVLGVAILLGVALAFVVTVLHVPGWAASLAAAAAAVVWLQLQPAEIPLTGAYDPGRQAAFLFTVVVAAAVLGGLIGSIKPVRRAVGRFRPVADPADRRGGKAAVLCGAAIVASMPLSVIAGVILVAGAGVPAQGSVGVNWFTWTLLGLGLALLAGTSAFGRRGGVFGTVLAVVALVLFHRFQQEQGYQIALLATAAGTVVIGLAATRLVERFGRPRTTNQDDPDRWETTNPAAAAPLISERGASATERGSTAESWATALPARPAPGRSSPWDDDPWNNR